MKFQKLSAFEKHFGEALSHHLSAVYVVVSQGEQERRKILSSLASHLKGRSDFLRCGHIDQALEHLSSGSLLSEMVAARYDDIEGLLKEEMQRLSAYCKRPNRRGCLLLSSSRSKEVNALYEVGKNDIVVLDLSKEKPWEEKERFVQWVLQVGRFYKKQIRPDAVEELLLRFPKDRILLQQELDKLVCYVGDRIDVTIADVRAICGATDEVHPYQIARDLVWDGKIPPRVSSDTAFPLVLAIRSQLEIGLILCALIRRGAAQEEIESALPRLFPKALQQCMQGARLKGSLFFQKGLMALFELEFGLKSSKGKPDVLVAQFAHHLQTYWITHER